MGTGNADTAAFTPVTKSFSSSSDASSSPAIATAPPPSAASSVASSAAAGLYKDGTYLGTKTDAYYGNVQVRVTVQSGKIADVQFLDYPQNRSTSRYINSQATPALRSEAIQIQSAPVDAVSGATYTSQAFNQSLASALAQAQQA